MACDHQFSISSEDILGVDDGHLVIRYVNICKTCQAVTGEHVQRKPLPTTAGGAEAPDA
jgi:hypothetical protein